MISGCKKKRENPALLRTPHKAPKKKHCRGLRGETLCPEPTVLIDTMLKHKLKKRHEENKKRKKKIIIINK